MDNRIEIRDFLSSRRAKITPERAGLPSYGSTRRVSGLRREEVAMLAGVSVDYYTRLERGNLSGVSGSVLEALARALQLDEAERIHLLDLARTANATVSAVRGRRRPSRTVRPGVQHILDAMTTAPAYVRNGRLDVLGANALGRAVFAPVFRTWWAAHNVRLHRSGVKRMHHAEVGDLTLGYESMELTADAGLRLNAYHAEPGSPSYDALRLLASWTTPTFSHQE